MGSDPTIPWPGGHEGLEHFNSGRYWHAHESWEQGWTRLPEAARRRIQGLIQVAAVAHLLEQGRIEPAVRLSRRALELFSAPDPGVGVEIPGAEDWLRQVPEAEQGEAHAAEVLRAAGRLRARARVMR